MTSLHGLETESRVSGLHIPREIPVALAGLAAVGLLLLLPDSEFIGFCPHGYWREVGCPTCE
ncbi:MAG: hypothetical protein AAB439_00015 [Patescibacteria group bacterium]